MKKIINNEKIFHIAHKNLFQKSISLGYTPESFNEEGFIHLCTESQFSGVIERYYSPIEKFVDSHIVIELSLDIEDKDLKWEGDKEKFPHLYRALRETEVLEIRDLSS